MKIMPKYAKFVGYRFHNGEKIAEWNCPNIKCGLGVTEEYVCCPWCGQRIKFQKPPEVKLIEIRTRGDLNDNDCWR